jgi:hypothetical protein
MQKGMAVNASSSFRNIAKLITHPPTSQRSKGMFRQQYPSMHNTWILLIQLKTKNILTVSIYYILTAAGTKWLFATVEDMNVGQLIIILLDTQFGKTYTDSESCYK